MRMASWHVRACASCVLPPAPTSLSFTLDLLLTQIRHTARTLLTYRISVILRTRLEESGFDDELKDLAKGALTCALVSPLLCVVARRVVLARTHRARDSGQEPHLSCFALPEIRKAKALHWDRLAFEFEALDVCVRSVDLGRVWRPSARV
jgi:hypothetical protein